MSEAPRRLRQPIVVILGHVDSGKCVSGDTLVQLADGRIWPARDVFEKFKSGTPSTTPDGVVYPAAGLELLSVSSGGSIVKRRASHVWKLRSDQLTRVSTRAGYELVTTPEHRFLVFRQDGGAEYVRAERLGIGDHLAVPQSAPVEAWPIRKIRGEILSLLPPGFLIQPDAHLQEQIEKYSRGAGVGGVAGKGGDRSLGQHIRRRRFRADVFRTLAGLCGSSMADAYDHIERVKSKGSTWLRVPRSEEELTSAFYLVGLLYGVGGSAHPPDASPSLIREYRACLRRAFGVAPRSSRGTPWYTLSFGGGETLSEFLTSAFGSPRAGKARTLTLPDILASAPDSLSTSFLAGLFDAGGRVEEGGGVGISLRSDRLMKRLPMLLQRFGVLAHFAKNGGRPWLVIGGGANLAAFRSRIGPRTPEKASLVEGAPSNARPEHVFGRASAPGASTTGFVRYGAVGNDVLGLPPCEGGGPAGYASGAALSLEPPRGAGLLEKLRHFRTTAVTGVETVDGGFDVFDFTVDEDHNFLANCMVVHNTTLADSLRGTAVQAREAGGITQEIGASFFPMETLKQISGPLLDRAGGELQIPGLLMIDTPGHAVFSNLRLRGGSAADIAILVVDVLKGLENQTLESIDILKQRHVPFLIALNKIDMISGWKKGSQGPLLQVMKEQIPSWNDELEERLYNVVGGMSRLGFQSDAYYRVKDFRQQVSIVPVSARTRTGIPEMLAILIGLAQQFLKGRLEVPEGGGGRARGIILEMQEEVGIGSTANVILTEGKLSVGDSIVLLRKEGAFKSKVKALFMPKPLDEMRDPRDKFTPVPSIFAAAGVKLVSPDLTGVIPGTTVASFRTEEEFQAIKGEMEKELTKVVVRTNNMGVIVKAGSIGGLEALLRMLEERGIPVREADIGDISKGDIVEAQVVGDHDPYLGAILGFGSKVLPEARDLAAGTPIFLSEIIYEVIDNYASWAAEKRDHDEKAALSSLTRPCKVRVLPGMFFRRNSPAVFGIEVLAGTLRPKVRLMSASGAEIGTLEQIQNQGEAVSESKTGDQVAISVAGPTLGRQIKEGDVLYTMPRSHEAKLLRTKLFASLSEQEHAVLREIIEIKARADPMYGF